MIFSNKTRDDLSSGLAPKPTQDRAVVGAWATAVGVLELATYLSLSSEARGVLMVSMAFAAVGALIFGNVLRLEEVVRRIGREQRIADDADELAPLPNRGAIARRRWASMSMVSIAAVVGLIAAIAARTDVLEATLFAAMSVGNSAGSILAGTYLRPRD